MKNLYACFLILAALCLFHPSVKAQVVLEPSMDTYVQQTNTNPATTNADTILRVRKSATGGTVTRNVYLRYDISNVTGILSKAELAMTVEVAANNAAPPVLDRADVHEVDDSWDPATLIYDNQPTAGAVVVALEGVSPIAAAVWPKPVYKVDVTSYVQSKLNSSASVVSFALSDDNNSGADLRMYSTRSKTNMGQLPIQLILSGATITGVEDFGKQIPSSFAVSQNYPNPFNPTTTIQYLLPKGAIVKLKIFNILGEEVSLVVNEFKEAGIHQAQWNANNVPSGVYFYRLQAGENVETKKMILLR